MTTMAHSWAEALKRRSGRPRAIYADPFDPITAGHLAIVERTAPYLEELTLLVTGTASPEALFAAEERALLAHEVTRALRNVTVDVTSRPVIELARERGALFLIRAVRDARDAERLAAEARLDYLSAPEVTPLFVPLPRRLAAVGSAELKDLARQGVALSRYCHPVVARRLQERIGAPG